MKSQLIGPDQKVIYTGEQESNGKYVFAAHMDGMYKYCFSNKMSTVTPKKLMFSMDIGDKPQAGLDNTTDGNSPIIYFQMLFVMIVWFA